jgi:hypothetical protein
VDPGETVGFAEWDGLALIDGRQAPMWQFVDDLARAQSVSGDLDHAGLTGPGRTYGLIVVEDWILTHNRQVRDSLAGDKCRTARAIGAIELICRLSGVPCVLQPNTIKSAAERIGAENLFLHPLHENRHANDAIRHGAYYLARNGAPGERGDG